MGSNDNLKGHNPHCFRSTTPFGKKKGTSHAQRMLTYLIQTKRKVGSSQLLKHDKHSWNTYQIIELNSNIRWKEGTYVLVKILGFHDSKNTPEPLHEMKRDVTWEVEYFMPTLGEWSLKHTVLQLFINECHNKKPVKNSWITVTL